MGLSLYDFRDLDLMLAVAAEVDDEGKISTEGISEAVGVDDRRAVGTRMAWMRRYGVFGYDEKSKLWSLTKGGERVLAARTKSAAADFTNVPDEAMVDVMAHVTARYRHGDKLNATLLRREFLFGTSPNSAAYAKRRRK
jgi:hypothetical protein